jgi:hypothetical protein
MILFLMAKTIKISAFKEVFEATRNLIFLMKIYDVERIIWKNANLTLGLYFISF